MSTNNILSIEPIGFPIPTAVIVTFQCKGGENRSYLYSSIEAVRGILEGEDPKEWDGERIA